MKKRHLKQGEKVYLIKVILSDWYGKVRGQPFRVLAIPEGFTLYSLAEAIVEGFTTMKSDLDAEKRAMMKIWSTREKQIEKVITNTTAMYGSIKGIGGKAIGSVPSLELGAGMEVKQDKEETL